MQQKDYSKIIAVAPCCKTARARTRQAGGERPKQAAHVITSPRKPLQHVSPFLQVMSASPFIFLSLGTFAISSVHPDMLQHRSRAIQGGRARC